MNNLVNGSVKWECKSIKFNNSVLVKKNLSSLYKSFILNLYSYFALKKCLSGTVKLIRNTIKSKFIYNSQKIAYDGTGVL